MANVRRLAADLKGDLYWMSTDGAYHNGQRISRDARNLAIDVSGVLYLLMQDNRLIRQENAGLKPVMANVQRLAADLNGKMYWLTSPGDHYIDGSRVRGKFRDFAIDVSGSHYLVSSDGELSVKHVGQVRQKLAEQVTRLVLGLDGQVTWLRLTGHSTNKDTFLLRLAPGESIELTPSFNAGWENRIMVIDHKNKMAIVDKKGTLAYWNNNNTRDNTRNPWTYTNTTSSVVTLRIVGQHKEAHLDAGKPWLPSTRGYKFNSDDSLTIKFEDGVDNDFNDARLQVRWLSF
jgi:hypothetical protein